MKKVIIVRHGNYDRDGGNLTVRGRADISALGASIKAGLNGESISIVSSTAPRAIESAEIIGQLFGVVFERHQFLWSGPDSPGKRETDIQELGMAMALIEESKADIVILVTHLEYSMWLPSFLAKKIFGNSAGFPFQETSKGEAWVIDCQTKNCVRLASRRPCCV